MSQYEKLVLYRDLVIDIIKKDISQSEIAKKYNKSEGYISQIAKKISQLRYPPEFDDDGNLVCFVCKEKIELLHIHHKHATGEQIAVVCHTCNLLIGDNDLSENSDYVKSPIPGPVIMSVPANSIVFMLKFENIEERTKAINNPKYAKLYGDLGQFAMANKGTMTSKTSKN